MSYEDGGTLSEPGTEFEGGDCRGCKSHEKGHGELKIREMAARCFSAS